MKSKWWVWSAAVALSLATVVLTARAQERGAPGPAELGAPAHEARGEPGRWEDRDDPDGLDPLLAADVEAGDDDPGDGPGMGPGRRGHAELREKLNLTDEQKSKLADIRDRQARAAIPIQGDLRIAGLDLHKLMRADRPDQRAIDAQIDRIASLRASLQKRRIAGMLEARSVLTPAQQKLMREQGGRFMGRGMRDGPRGHGGPGLRMRHL